MRSKGLTGLVGVIVHLKKVIALEAILGVASHVSPRCPRLRKVAIVSREAFGVKGCDCRSHTSFFHYIPSVVSLSSLARNITKHFALEFPVNFL